MNLLINQRIQLEQIVGKGLANDGSVPAAYTAVSGLINANAVKAANDGSIPSDMRDHKELDKNFADFKLIVPISETETKVYTFGGPSILKARYTSDDIISLSPIVRFARRKRLITTPVLDTSEIVERWATEGYDISIDGLMVDLKNHQYPRTQIIELRNLFDHNKIVKVQGELFLDVGISNIYITSFSMEPMVGYPDTVIYNIQARSIKSLTFKLTS